jgi:hypothetical protein
MARITTEEVKDEEMLIDTKEKSPTKKEVKIDTAVTKVEPIEPEWPQINLTAATCSFLKLLVIDE